MDRREFLTRSWRRSAAEPRRSPRWVRPPYALDESEFLEKCTGCGDCISACPHGVIFALGAKAGLRAETTPVLDLLKRGCHLCTDWPCAAACETGALLRPEEEAPPPRLATATVDTSACIAYQGPECGACAHACPVPEALTWEGGIRPVIRPDVCTGCAMCREACIVEPKAIRISAHTRDDAP